MLAPLLLGTGMLTKTISANASFLVPRFGLLVVLLWFTWFANSVVQNTWIILRNQVRAVVGWWLGGESRDYFWPLCQPEF